MLSGLLRTMRPHQWVKNFFVLVPLVFAQELFNLHASLRALGGFAIFCLVAGAVYILNDLVDVEADRAHPTKKNRPIASGKVTEGAARTALGVLILVALVGMYFLGWPFLGATTAYLALNLAYSFALKNIAYVDVLCIAAGFELRVIAGAFAAEVPASWYVLVVTFLFATFLGLGKRLHEIGHSGEGATRAALKKYDPRTVTALMAVTGVLTLGTYVAYTLDPHTHEMFGTRYLWVSTVFALYGFFRFVQLVRRKDDAESPTDAMLGDMLFLANLVLWAICIVVLIYFGWG
jgi:decaprenyl-phosphate phosphoribosyltransferase